MIIRKDKKILRGRRNRKAERATETWQNYTVPTTIIVDRGPIDSPSPRYGVYITYSTENRRDLFGIDVLRKYVYKVAKISPTDALEFSDEKETVSKTDARPGLIFLHQMAIAKKEIHTIFVLDQAGLGWPEGIKDDFINHGINLVELEYEIDLNDPEVLKKFPAMSNLMNMMKQMKDDMKKE